MDDQIDPGDNFLDADLNEKIASLNKSVVSRGYLIAKLESQLAAQSLAHAEQMEGMRASMPKKSGSQLYAEMMGQAVDQCELTNLHRELASARAFIERLKAAELSSMRVTPATQPTDAQQTASDIDPMAAPERRPDGTLKPVARAWEAPKRTTDVRRLGG